ncbi:MAG: oligosaccharide flippase family protein [Planctomycetes bacterium]|nr:oligosaccharide flippase family protein [Planctomycetota bacterium]
MLSRGIHWLRTTRTSAAALTRGAAAAMLLRLAGAGLSLAVGLALARLLGAKGYGAYVYAVAWLAFATPGATLGLDGVLVRYVAAYRRTGRWGALRGLLGFAQGLGVAASAGLLLAALLVLGLNRSLDPDARLTGLVVLSLLPVVVSATLRQATLRGLERVATGQLPETLVQPLVILAGAACLGLALRRPATSVEAAAVHAAAAVAAFLLGCLLLRRSLPPELRGAPRDREARVWISMGLPLLAIGWMQVLLNKGDLLLLGALSGSREAGVYAVASRVADAVLLVFDSTSLVAAPMIAGAHAAGQKEELQRIVRSVARLNLWLSAPICVAFLVLAPWLLGLFGEEFVQGTSVLRILVLGQLFSASAGAVGQILYMTGHARAVAVAVGACGALNLALASALIPRYGALGAATSAAISIATFKTSLAALIWRRLGVISGVLDSRVLRRLRRPRP